MREELHQGGSDEDSDSSHASADAARLHAVARRIQLREHTNRQQQLQLHKQLQQQQQLLQQQQQQLHQQDALLRHQEQLLQQQEQQLASRETEAGLLLQQVGLLQQQLEERADRLAAAEGNYLDAAALLQQLQQRVTMGAEAKLLVEEVRQQQQQDSHHLYAEVRRLRRQLSLQMRLSPPADDGDRDKESSEKGRDKAAEQDLAQSRLSCESPAAPTAAGDLLRQQHRADEQPTSVPSPWRGSGSVVNADGAYCCAEAAETAACTAWGCSACCTCSDDAQHEAAVDELRAALHKCRCAMESRGGSEAAASPGAVAAANAAVLSVKEAIYRCPAAGADAEIVDVLLERLRAESMQVRVYAQQRRAAAAAGGGSSAVLQPQQAGALVAVEESLEKEAYDVMGTALPQEVLLPLLAVQSISTLLRLKQQSVELANSRWLRLLRDTVGSKFLEGSPCCSDSQILRSTSSGVSGCSGNTAHRKAGGAASELGAQGDNSTATSANTGEAGGERRQHVLLQLLLRGSGGLIAAAGLLRQSTAPLALHAATLTDMESGNNIFHLLCLRNLPQLFGILNLSSLPWELIYAQNRQGKTPSDLLPSLLPPQLLQLKELQEAAAAGEIQPQAVLQQQLAAAALNLRAWRSVVFEYAAKASALYRQHNNEAALSLYTEALNLQQRLLEKQQRLDEATGGNGACSLSLRENTAKLAFNKARSALRLSRWICSLQSCTLCLSMTPNYKAAYETAAEACEWLLDFEGALNYVQLLRQHCPDAFSSEHFHKRRLYEAQLQASSFQVLGLDRGAPKAEVNRAFRRMSILWHPDKACALSEDLRLRHENHFKRLNEARITLLDPESYARQLLVPTQPLYRHPELLVAPTRSQQQAPSSASLSQPDQLTSELLQQEQQQREQPQDQRQDNEDVEPSLEKLQQQRHQLLRSIESLQRQQRELQRELEEQHAAAPQRTGSSNASASLRWQELQKLQQQQQNKEKRLAECESEICQRLRQQQQEPPKQGDNDRKGSDEGVKGSLDQARRTPQERQHQQQPQEQQRQNDQRNDLKDGVSVSSRNGQATSSEFSPSDSTAAASAATATAAEVAREAAASPFPGQVTAKSADETQPWTPVIYGDSDTEAPALGSVLQGEAATSSGCGSSAAGLPTANFGLPFSSPSKLGINSVVQGGSDISRAPTKTGSLAAACDTAPSVASGTAHARQRFRGCRTMGRSGSRASSAGPHIWTGETASVAAACTATARRSLTTCICSSAPRRATAPTGVEREAHPHKRNSAYWEETNSSNSSSNCSSSDGNASSDSNGSDDDGRGRTLERHNDRPWNAASGYVRDRFGGAANSPTTTTNAACSHSAGQVGGQPQQQQQQQQPQQYPLPTPPPRRVPATQGTKGGSSEILGHSSGKARAPVGRRPLVRTRPSQHTQQQPSKVQQQHLHQQRQRQQLWPGSSGRGEAAARYSPSKMSPTTSASQNAGVTSPQGDLAGASLRPPDFPEPFGAAGRQCAPHEGCRTRGAAGPTEQPSQQQQMNHSIDYSICGESGQQPNAEGWQNTPTAFHSPVLLSQSFDLHGMQQQGLTPPQSLQRNLQSQVELQEDCESARHQLLFPDEELLFGNPQASMAATSAAPAVDAPATAADSRPSGTESANAPAAAALFESGWAAFDGAADLIDIAADDGANSERKYRWPVPPHCGAAAPEATSNTRTAARQAANKVPSEVSDGRRTKGLEPGKSNSASEVQRRTGGHGSTGQSCKSSESSSVSPSCSSESGSSNCSRGENAVEGRAEAFGHRRIPSHSQQQQPWRQQYQQQQGRLYRSLVQEMPHLQRSSLDAESILLIPWGIGAPQRSSVPVSGRASSNSATLCKDAVTVTTPVRLFAKYGEANLEMEQDPQMSGLASPQLAPGNGQSDSSTAAAIPTKAHVPRTINESQTVTTSDCRDSGDGRGMLRDDAPLAGRASAPLGPWQPLLTGSSLSYAEEETLLHSPRLPRV